MTITRRLIIFLFVTTPAFSAPPDVPSRVAVEIQTRYRGSTILAATPCMLGDDKANSWGLVIKTVSVPEVKTPDVKHPLRALAIIERPGGWKVNDIGLSISNSKGLDRNFLRGFWFRDHFVAPYEIRCAVPDIDPDIRMQASGEYIQPFEPSKERRHLCFQASGVYNSWACVSLMRSMTEPATSFIQMNAD